ncbi:MAG: DUF2202 domain-containing protein, partial [Synergistetes bacterium]|nr:DUF2202 domain-containing protein [Synergistota bacterium]
LKQQMTKWVFENKKLQEIYNNLVKKGSTSLLEALKVGTMVEELNIKDLQEHLKNTNESVYETHQKVEWNIYTTVSIH